MNTVVSEHVFLWLRTLGGNGTTYSKHMEGARLTIPPAALLAKVVDMIDKVPMEDRDTKGDLYEILLLFCRTDREFFEHWHLFDLAQFLSLGVEKTFPQRIWFES
jgi:hypothetical protein